MEQPLQLPIKLVLPITKAKTLTGHRYVATKAADGSNDLDSRFDLHPLFWMQHYCLLCGLELFLVPACILIFSSTSDMIFDAERLRAFAS